MLVEPFELPEHYRRIAGSDFGIDHPAAGAWLAHDADTDTIFLYDCYKEPGQTAAYHAQAFKARGDWIPVAWPHDGMQRDKGSGEPLANQYRDRGANMLAVHATWPTEKNCMAISREAGNQEILERMMTGRFKVFNTPACHLFIGEIGLLHRKDGQIVAEKDGPVLRATVVDPVAGEIIHELMYIVGWEAMPAEAAAYIHAHPTVSEAIGETLLASAGRPLH